MGTHFGTSDAVDTLLASVPPLPPITLRDGTAHQLTWSEWGRIRDRFTVAGPSDCWMWTGTTYEGYGKFSLYGKELYAHRLTYMIFVGPIPKGLYLDHLCRNHSCVSPAHLEPVTNEENIRRGNFSATINREKTHCLRGHPLSGDNLYTKKDGRRNCRICALQYAKEWRLRSQAKAAEAQPESTTQVSGCIADPGHGQEF